MSDQNDEIKFLRQRQHELSNVLNATAGKVAIAVNDLGNYSRQLDRIEENQEKQFDRLEAWKTSKDETEDDAIARITKLETRLEPVEADVNGVKRMVIVSVVIAILGLIGLKTGFHL